MKTLSIILLSCIACGCSHYYYYNSTTAVKIYDSPKGPGSVSFTLPAHEQVIVDRSSTTKYKQVRYKNYFGWVDADSLQLGKRTAHKNFGDPEKDGFVWDTSVSPTGAVSNTPAKATAPRGKGNGQHGGNGGHYGGGQHRRQQY